VQRKGNLKKREGERRGKKKKREKRHAAAYGSRLNSLLLLESERQYKGRGNPRGYGGGGKGGRRGGGGIVFFTFTNFALALEGGGEEKVRREKNA